jgi:hypothetical protein
MVFLYIKVFVWFIKQACLLAIVSKFFGGEGCSTKSKQPLGSETISDIDLENDENAFFGIG